MYFKVSVAKIALNRYQLLWICGLSKRPNHSKLVKILSERQTACQDAEYSAFHPDPSCLHVGLWSQLAG